MLFEYCVYGDVLVMNHYDDEEESDSETLLSDLPGYTKKKASTEFQTSSVKDDLSQKNKNLQKKSIKKKT